ncbi:scavenger receptor cysteine-rich domain-containing protein SCART1-like isoform X2 [Buteo buteo]|uniref:scavenger receptor cysteine-rich domain-containing protein SCART1-like isoform X2 n=1 Tax=Buteo buteo TaxID=30397 RepID=UPI003EC05CA4
MLQDCPHFGWGRHFCGHNWDVGVTCTDAVELRLAAGGGPCAGRVEVKLQGRWGSVADDAWDMEDAEVVCQQLGCGSAAAAFAAGSRFGKVDGPISLTIINCRGDEAALWNCEIRGWGPYVGIHDFDTAVICQGFARLVGGDSSCAGRLEVRRGRAWTGVCEDSVDIEAARVVCRELGCGAVLAVPGSGRFEAGKGPLWDEGFNCVGTEPLLATCARRPARGRGCTGHASIICSSYTGFRLVGNNSSCAGRVEVEAGGTWGSLCATGWDLPDAHVLCHHLGCGAAAAVPPGGFFGGGDGPLRRDAFGCDGSERHPGECPVVVLGEPACPPGHAAAVNCSGIAEPPRLVEGESRCDGRLEVAASPGVWARVPTGLWDARGASVVCRQLGCGVPEKVYGVPGSGTAGLRGLRCAGTEENLAQCNVSGTAAVPTGSPEEVAVVCSGSRRVRLADGPGRCAGRAEVYIDGTWRGVCREAWGMSDAAVVCRQLGCGTALPATGSARFGPGTGPLWPGTGGCAGTEASLWDCPASARHGCRRDGGAAAAVCSALPAAGGRQRPLQRTPGGLLQRHLGPRVRQRHRPRHGRRRLPAAGLRGRGEAGGQPRPGYGPCLVGLGGLRGGGPFALALPFGAVAPAGLQLRQGRLRRLRYGRRRHERDAHPVPAEPLPGRCHLHSCPHRQHAGGGEDGAGANDPVRGPGVAAVPGPGRPGRAGVPRLGSAQRSRQSRGRRLRRHLRGARLSPDAGVPGGAQSLRVPVGGVGDEAAVLHRGRRGGG